MSNRQEKVLALAVSLWIAGGGYGGMASAAGVTVNSPEDVEAKATGDDAVLVKKEYAEEVAPNVYVRDYWYTLKNDTDTELTIAGGDYTAAEYYLAARYMASGEGDASGGKLTVKAGQFTNHLYGGRSQDGKASIAPPCPHRTAA